MPGDMNQALALAIGYCFDESHGYSSLGDQTSHTGYPDFDCGGLVGRCLHEAGYPVAAVSPGTRNMRSWLAAAGFNIITVSGSSPLIMPQHGDIVVANVYNDLAHTDIAAGHTWFYGENVKAYTDPNADSDNISLSCPQALIEAASKRDQGVMDFGDTRKNGTGAYWQVWSHAFTSVYKGYDPTDPYTDIFIGRDPNFNPSSNDKKHKGWFVLLHGSRLQHHLRGGL